jgi:hypothetical protein
MVGHACNPRKEAEVGGSRSEAGLGKRSKKKKKLKAKMIRGIAPVVEYLPRLSSNLSTKKKLCYRVIWPGYMCLLIFFLFFFFEEFFKLSLERCLPLAMSCLSGDVGAPAFRI